MSDFKVPAGFPLTKPKAPSPSSSDQNGQRQTSSKEQDQLTKPEPSLPPPPPSQKKPQEDPLTLNLEKQAKYQQILSSLKYKEPSSSSSSPDVRYSFEILKNGTIVDTFKFSKMDNKGFYVVGRVPACDIVAENPTVSRCHAVLQFIDGGGGGSGGGRVQNGEEGDPNVPGLYLYDLNSTHGTFINKNQVFPNRYYRLRVGHVLRFGNSTRLYVLLGPSEDEEEESDKSVTELQNEKLQREMERKKLEEQGLLIKCSETGEDDVCAWGMGEDAIEEADNRENPFAMNFEESESFDNPKKTLRGWFESQGEDLVYDVREKAPGQFICRINLPIDGPGGQPVFAEVDVKGKKKEAVAQGALQACQILDKYGVLRVSHHESKSKKKEKNWAEQDYYSSDEDTFLDRTGSVEKKREKRMKVAGKLQTKAETFESLTEKSKTLQEEIDSLHTMITDAQLANDGGDDVDVDDYVKLLKTGASDVRKLKTRLREATEELKNVNKLLDIAKPAPLPSYLSGEKKEKPAAPKRELPQDELSPTVSIKRSHISISLSGSSSKSKQQPDSNKPDSETVTPTQPQQTKPKPPVKLFGPRFPTKPIDVSKSPNIPPTAQAGETSSKGQDKVSYSDSRAKPPSKPQPQDNNSSDSSDDDLTHPKNKNKKKNPRQRQPKITKDKEVRYEYDASDPKYSTWVPPTDQKGDGKTSLNEKLGY